MLALTVALLACPPIGGVVHLKAPNGLEVKLDGDRVRVGGPTPATGDVAGPQVAFGSTVMTGDTWWFEEPARFVGATWTADALTVVRRKPTGEPGPPVVLRGVDACAAEALVKRLDAIRASSAASVPPAKLFAEPATFDGQQVRLEGVGASMRFESQALWLPDHETRIWLDAPIPEGVWWVDVVGHFEARPGHRYGHLGGFDAKLSVSRVVRRRPVGETLGALAVKAVGAAAEKAFAEKVKKPTLGWSPELSPPIPANWPDAGPVCFTLYARGVSKMGDEALGSAWGKACIDPKAPEAVKLEVTDATLRPLGELEKQKGPSILDRIADHTGWLIAEGIEVPDGERALIPKRVEAWRADKRALDAAFEAHHPKFAAALD